MMKIFYYLRGYSVIEICGASPGWALNKISDARIAFWDICQIDSMTVRVKVFRGSEQYVCSAAASAMCDSKTVATRGIFEITDRIVGRPVLLIMLLFSILAALLLPCFVFFYEVEGNETIPEQRILRALNGSEIGFGTYGPYIYPRRARDRVIADIPELQWLTIVQNGCRAKVVVREREQAPALEARKGFANVIASRSGIITKQAVYLGQPLCKVGDTVSKGEVLVSGVVDLERTYLLEPANAEIFARTWRQIAACIPTSYRDKSAVSGQKKCLWLVFGGRRIKIFGNSGISYGSCDKMISTKTVTLPQGLQLPISVVTETFCLYEDHTTQMKQSDAERILTAYAEEMTNLQMKAGQILGKSGQMEKGKGQYLLTSTLECHEMIAEVVEAKWNNEEFTND